MSDTTAPIRGHGVLRRLCVPDLRHSYISVTDANETDESTTASNSACRPIYSGPISQTPLAARSLFSPSGPSSDNSAWPVSPAQPARRVQQRRPDSVDSSRVLLSNGSTSSIPTRRKSNLIDRLYPYKAQNGLCLTCWEMTMDDLALSRLLSKQGYTHHSREDMDKSASMGCPICAAVMQYVSVGLSQEITRNTWVGNVQDSMITDILRGVAKEPLSLLSEFVFYASCGENENISGHSKTYFKQIEVRNRFRVERVALSPTMPTTHIMRFQVYTREDSPAAQMIPQRPIVAHLRSLAALSASRSLIRKCLLDHRECKRAMLPLLPTRVLCVGEPNLDGSAMEDFTPDLRLHISLREERSEYTALSYCWGGPQSIVTSTATLESHAKGININNLPKTIQDAVEVTRGMGIKYLWVDALCILQDEISDKSHEIYRMGEIFNNATVTIAVANSSAADEGFLRPIDSTPSIQSLLVGETVSKIWLVPQIDHDHSQDPLAKRGWAFQEQILSPRLLHYGSKGLTWTCQSERSKEVVPHYVNYALRSTRFPWHVQERMKEEVDWPSSSRGSVIAQFWPEMVEDYCNRNLTLAGDRLLAIAGVAAEFHKLRPDVYLAGVWKGDLIRQLAWRRKLRAEEQEWQIPLGTYHAPTWTWASLGKPINFGPIFEPDATFVMSSVRPRMPSSPFGDVVGRRLALSAKIMQSPSSLLMIILDDPLGLNYQGPSGLGQIRSDAILQTSSRIWYMLLGYSSHNAPIGLVLVKSKDESVRFERIGYFESPDLVDPCSKLKNYLSTIKRKIVEII